MTKRLDAKTKEIKALQRKWARAEKKCQDLKKLELEAWKKFFPKFKKQYEALPKSMKGTWGDCFPEGLNDTEIHLVDSAGQKFDFRVGPVFGGKGIYATPGLWIGVQEYYMSSGRNLEFLISPELWKKLTAEIESRFKRYNAKGYGPRKVIKVKK